MQYQMLKFIGGGSTTSTLFQGPADYKLERSNDGVTYITIASKSGLDCGELPLAIHGQIRGQNGQNRLSIYAFPSLKDAAQQMLRMVTNY